MDRPRGHLARRVSEGLNAPLRSEWHCSYVVSAACCEAVGALWPDRCRPILPWGRAASGSRARQMELASSRVVSPDAFAGEPAAPDSGCVGGVAPWAERHLRGNQEASALLVGHEDAMGPSQPGPSERPLSDGCGFPVVPVAPPRPSGAVGVAAGASPAPGRCRSTGSRTQKTVPPSGADRTPTSPP